MDLSAFEGRPLDKATLTAATEVIMQDITALLAGIRGEEPPAERWDPSAHNQSKHGRKMQKSSPETIAGENDAPGSDLTDPSRGVE